MSFGERLRLARVAKGLTQKQLAKEMNCATGTVQQYELSKRSPRKKQIDSLLFVLKLPYSFFTETQPFEDLDFLEQYKSVVLFFLEKNELFERGERAINEIEDYEYWSLVAEHIVSIVKTNKNTLSIQRKNQHTESTDKVKFEARSLGLNFAEVLEPLMEKHAITTFGILRNLNRLNSIGHKEADRSIAIIAGNPDFQCSSEPPPSDSPTDPPEDE